MKRLMLVCLVLLAMAGCRKPYHVPVLVEVGNSEAAFLVELTGASDQASLKSEDYLKSKLVQQKRIEIPYEWKPEGRWENSDGKWIPSARLIIVDRSPETRVWTATEHTGTTKNNEAIWVESADSVNFSTGITITARIETEEDAVKFLFNYPARADEEKSQEKSKKSAENVYQIAVSSLKNIMDTEIRARIQMGIADEAAKYKMDELRDKKAEIMTAVRKNCEEFFKKRGIMITTLGMVGGLTYDNKEIQTSIDKVMQAQQDKAVAKAEYDAATERQKALKAKGEGEAAMKIEVAKGEAKAVKEVAEAKAFELEKLNQNPQAYLLLKQLEIEKLRLQSWNGQYPMYLMSGGNSSFLMGMPMIDPTTIKANPTLMGPVKDNKEKLAVPEKMPEAPVKK